MIIRLKNGTPFELVKAAGNYLGSRCSCLNPVVKGSLETVQEVGNPGLSSGDPVTEASCRLSAADGSGGGPSDGGQGKNPANNQPVLSNIQQVRLKEEVF